MASLFFAMFHQTLLSGYVLYLSVYVTASLDWFRFVLHVQLPLQMLIPGVEGTSSSLQLGY